MQQLTAKELREQLNRFVPLRECLSCGVGPHLKVHKCDEPLSLCCPNCGFSSGSFPDLQPVVTDWHRSNKPNDEHIAEVWGMRFERQQSALEESL